MQQTTKLQYKLEAFEGPLDMLLTLISKHKLDIYDIQISELLEQYMIQINAMQEKQMDIASEFLEMASRLVYIKSVMLLPKHEEAEELKKELEGQLLDYRECQRTAALFGTMACFDIYTRKPTKIEYDMTYTRIHPSKDIADAFVSAAGRGKRRLPPSVDAFSGIVTRKVVSVNSRIVYVMRRLRSGEPVKFYSLFPNGSEKSELVATFLALLELIKGKRVRVSGSDDDATVFMVKEDDTLDKQ